VWARETTPQGGPWLRSAGVSLANRGRFLALSMAPAIVDPGTFRECVVLEGTAHLDAARRRGGAILMGFHVLPGVAALALASSGYRFAVTGVAGGFRGWLDPVASWGPVLDAWREPVMWDDTASRSRGLVRLAAKLRARELVHITADGPSGRELFRVRLPAGTAVIRSGWWALRRLTGAVTLPVLAHRDGRSVIVRVSPPLPGPMADAADDLRVCETVIRSLLTAHVARFPEQCATLVNWSAPRPAS
jgi:lauroyl/myristoyl acyltransferase